MLTLTDINVQKMETGKRLKTNKLRAMVTGAPHALSSAWHRHGQQREREREREREGGGGGGYSKGNQSKTISMNTNRNK